MPVRDGEVVDAACLEVAADPAGLDVDHLRRPETDRRGSGLRRRDRLVEADRRPDDLREVRVAEQVLLLERLLDEEQIEVVELGEVSRVTQRVRGVGVDLQQHLVTEALSDGADHLHIPAGFDLELDPDVPLRDVAVHRVEQGGYRVHDPDRDAARHAVARRAQFAGE